MEEESWSLNKEVARELLRDESTSAAVLHLIFAKYYGLDALYGNEEDSPVDPIILWNDVERDFRIRFPEENENKMNALMLAASTNLFFESPDIFASICLAIADGDLGDEVNGMMSDPPSVFELLTAINEVDLVDGDRDALFHRPVRELVEYIFSSEGVDQEEHEDIYGAEVEAHMMKIKADLISVGVPEYLTELPDDTDYYGLLE